MRCINMNILLNNCSKFSIRQIQQGLLRNDLTNSLDNFTKTSKIDEHSTLETIQIFQIILQYYFTYYFTDLTDF